MPRVHGDGIIHFSQFDAVVPHDGPLWIHKTKVGDNWTTRTTSLTWPSLKMQNDQFSNGDILGWHRRKSNSETDGTCLKDVQDEPTTIRQLLLLKDTKQLLENMDKKETDGMGGKTISMNIRKPSSCKPVDFLLGLDFSLFFEHLLTPLLLYRSWVQKKFASDNTLQSWFLTARPCLLPGRSGVHYHGYWYWYIMVHGIV